MEFLGEYLFKEKVLPEPLPKTFLNREKDKVGADSDLLCLLFVREI